MLISYMKRQTNLTLEIGRFLLHYARASNLGRETLTTSDYLHFISRFLKIMEEKNENSGFVLITYK